MTSTLEEALQTIQSQPDYKVLKRVPEQLETIDTIDSRVFRLAIIDLETTGLKSETDEIIEIGTLIVEFTNEHGFTAVAFTDNQLQEPNSPISAEITAITGITNDEVAGCQIDWDSLLEALADVDLVVCHNANFDRKFLERQTPEKVSQLFQKKAFGCSARDIDWKLLGYEGAKLEYLNLKMGYFYAGHRALVDCWATLNILNQVPEAFAQLKQSVREKQLVICAINADFDKKDILKERGYRWSDGSSDLPKCWHTVVKEDAYEDEMHYLQTEIYGGRSVNLPSGSINAFSRYSGREYQIPT
ncbi:MAG: DNA polymerase III subunit epsilon [Enterobacterales bacterium]|nr:DNA polymerase III subunit epsilon [Enterobacterales bacterium]